MKLLRWLKNILNYIDKFIDYLEKVVPVIIGTVGFLIVISVVVFIIGWGIEKVFPKIFKDDPVEKFLTCMKKNEKLGIITSDKWLKNYCIAWNEEFLDIKIKAGLEGLVIINNQVMARVYILNGGHTLLTNLSIVVTSKNDPEHKEFTFTNTSFFHKDVFIEPGTEGYIDIPIKSLEGIVKGMWGIRLSAADGYEKIYSLDFGTKYPMGFEIIK